MQLLPPLKRQTAKSRPRQSLGLLVGAALTCAAALTGCRTIRPTGRTLTMIENGATDYVVVCDQASAPARFAAGEFTEIIKGSTDVQLDMVDAASDRARSAPKRILIGRNRLVRDALGDKLLDSLQAQESLVTARGDDLILVGGDDWGTLYAVYDFVENEAGYRCILPVPDGERFVKTDTLVFSGHETRRTMAFRGYRDGHPRKWRTMDPDAAARFFFRNRLNSLKVPNSDFAKDSGLREQFSFKNHCHGFGFIGWDETFAEHPEYFTMNKDGERISTAQLCLSNPDCRKYVTGKVMELIADGYPKGINCYVVASNDHHGNRYCWCPDCLALEKKYNATGGPLWDYLVELCGEVKQKYPGVYISSLAYKGLVQTEQAPDNLVFPENFIADCAFLNSMLTLTEIPAEPLPDGGSFQKYENLKKWRTITNHVSYWFYGHATGPTAIYERPAKELRELRDAGVESIFHCNFGGEQQFGAVTRYVTLRLMIDPDQDPKALAREAADFLYGPAAEMMMAHMAEMEELRLTPGLSPVAQNPFPAFTMLKPGQILRWRADFDKMEALTASTPKANFHVRVSRTAVDVWTLIFLRKIQKAFPDFKPDLQALIDKGLTTCDEMRAAKIEGRDNKVRRALESLRLWAHLKDDSLPPDLQSYPAGDVIRHLPGKESAKTVFTPDKDAVTGFAIRSVVPDKERFTYTDKVGFEFYDAGERKWLLNGKNAGIPRADIAPNRYKLYKVGTSRMPKNSRFVVASLWGSGVDIAALGGYHIPEFHNRHFEIWISLKFEGPKFDPKSTAAESAVSWDQIFLVDKGIVE